jgi:predicted nuclease of predicted toxin-antitoxin system
MKLLLDANLSYRLAKKLTTESCQCLHVSRTGLPNPAEDIAIWNWAKANSYIIVTNDDDYYNLANTYGFPPKVVLLRMGNQSSTSLAEILQLHYEDVVMLDKSDEFGLLELF